MAHQHSFPPRKSAQLVERGGFSLQLIKKSLRFDQSRPIKAAHRTAERLQQDKIRALILVGLMLLAWAFIVAVGQAIDLHPDTVHTLCIACGVTINAITIITMTAEIHSTPSIPMTAASCSKTPFNSAFTSCFISQDTPPPRSIS